MRNILSHHICPLCHNIFFDCIVSPYQIHVMSLNYNMTYDSYSKGHFRPYFLFKSQIVYASLIKKHTISPSTNIIERLKGVSLIQLCIILQHRYKTTIKSRINPFIISFKKNSFYYYQEKCLLYVNVFKYYTFGIMTRLI